VHRFLTLLGVALLLTVILLQSNWVADNQHELSGCHLSQNAAWISVDWTAAVQSEESIRQLAEEAQKRHLAYLYPYTTYLQPDGTFNNTYEYAAEFVTQFRRFNQSTRLLAWIGIPVENSRFLGIRGWVDLDEETERTQIVNFVTQLLQEVGFDGVHLNVETVQDGDRGYLNLLDETRQAIGTSSMLSIASTYWAPAFLNSLPGVDGFRWTTAYYGEIAARVDQIVTMTYDSAMPSTALYRIWLKRQISAIHESVAQSDVELLVGLSASQENTFTHRTSVENMKSGLAGICAGISGLPSPNQVKGIAIYAYWERQEADEEEWNSWLDVQADR